MIIFIKVVYLSNIGGQTINEHLCMLNVGHTVVEAVWEVR